MATANEVEARVRTLKSLKEQLDNAETLGPDSVQVGNRTLTVQQLLDLVSATDKQIKQLERQLAPLRSAQAELSRAKEIAASPLTESPTGLRPGEAQSRVVEAEKKLADLADMDFVLPAQVPSLEAPRRGGMETVAQARAEAARQPARAGRRATAGTPGATGPTGPAPAGTTGTGGGVRVPGKKKTTPSKPKPVVNWEPKFREMFPAQAWLLDIDRTKYADVFKLFEKAVSNQIWGDEAALAVFQTQLQGTSFMRELAQTGKARTVKELVGDLGFDTVPFNKFLTTAMNMGWDDATLKQEAYKEAFRKDATGQYVNPTALARVRKSNDFLTVKSIGKEYFSDVSDSIVEQRLTGVITDVDVDRQQREIAKTKYTHLSSLLDQGVTLEDIASSYRQRAAQMLEKNVNDIDMGSADFSKAFNFGEEGKKRMMGDGEWEILLRSDPTFGWRKTQNAKEEARQLASSIAQAFGRTL